MCGASHRTWHRGAAQLKAGVGAVVEPHGRFRDTPADGTAGLGAQGEPQYFLPSRSIHFNFSDVITE